MRVSRVREAIVVGLLCACAPAVRSAPDPRAADAAFDAGDSARALALYDEILAAEPDDINALLKSGKLLSWARKFDAALARYDRALSREPDNTAVLLERAKVLLWSGRYGEAVPAFERVLRLAPNEPWALCGTAQAYAWRGRGREARPFYERALAAAPGMKEAMLGLAYLDLADGDTTAALERSKALAAAAPADPEVVELERQVRRARSPWVQVGWDGASDSEDNRMNTYRAEVGLAIPARWDLRFGYAHSDFRGLIPPGVEARSSADSLCGVAGFRPRRGHRAELRLGATRLTDSVDDTRTVGIGGFSYWLPMKAWTGTVTVTHDPFLYSPRILDSAIDVTSLTVGASGPVTQHVRVETNASYGDLSDDNRRLWADAGVWYVWKWPGRSLSLGGVARYLDYSHDLDNGYFDPSGLIAGFLSLRTSGAIGASVWWYEAALEAGAQSFTLNGDETSGEPLWSVHALLARPLPHGFSFQVFADFSNSSTASGPGFTSRSGGVRLRYTFGG